ncbi:MAG: hypothetical protein M3Q71_01380 [Chloroflexota bacterium]|nr:hypothetical protein [Chloroflexota bacterium]
MGGATVAGGGWDLALAGVLVIVLGVMVIAIPQLWSPVGVFVVGIGAGALAVVASRVIRRRS